MLSEKYQGQEDKCHTVSLLRMIQKRIISQKVRECVLPREQRGGREGGRVTKMQ